MADNPHHEHLLKELSQQLKPIFTHSPQAVYLYLDDEHKNCNQKFADLLGYTSVSEWVTHPTPLDDVTSADQDRVIKAYMHASQKFQAISLSVTLNSRNGQKIKTEIIMAPVTYKDEVFVLHFINRKGGEN